MTDLTELQALLNTRKAQTIRAAIATASLSREFMLYSMFSYFEVEDVEKAVAALEKLSVNDTKVHYSYAIEKLAEAGCKVSVFLKNGARTHSSLLIESPNDLRVITFDAREEIPIEELARVQKELKLP